MHRRKNHRILIKNGTFEVQNDSYNPNWVLVENGIIVDMGSDKIPDIEDCEVIDADGGYIIPGLIDNHVHLVQSGINKFTSSTKDVTDFRSLFQLINSAQPIKTEYGPLIYLSSFEEIKLTEGKLPTRWDLDRICCDKMILINTVDYQISILNSKAYRFINLMFNIEGIDRNYDNIPTGILKEKASLIARKRILDIIPMNYTKQGVDIVIDEAIEYGLTTLVAMEGGHLFNDKDAEFICKHRYDYKVDIELFYQTTNIEKVKSMGLKRIGGNIMLDGSIQAKTAALHYPYYDKFSTRGKLYFNDNELEKFVSEAVKAKLDISLHAVGPRAISQALYIYYKVKNAYPDNECQFRIEHFELPTNEDIEFASKLGVILSMQPSCGMIWGGYGQTYEKRLGIDRTLRANPMRSILEAGGIIACGSESDLTPLNPLVGIHAMVNHPNEKERISVKEAIKLYTVVGAEVLRDSRKGKIEIGYKADLVIFDRNLNTVSTNDILNAKVMNTIKDGEIIFRRL